MNLTEFGKLLRRLRLDKLIRLKDMAEAIGVSSAFLSAVETGNKEIPDNLVQNIIQYLQLDEQQISELYKAVDETRKSITITMPIANDDRYLIGAFARNLNHLDEEKKERILRLLRGDE